MYIDESGDTATLQQGGSRFLVLTGCIIPESRKVDIELAFRTIKKKFYADPDIEIKSNFLRYANPDILGTSSPIKLHDRERYNELEAEVTRLLQSIDVTLLCVILDKKGFWSDYPSKNPYESAYSLLLHDFQTFLEENRSLGLCILDPREGKVEKRFMDAEIDRAHHSLRWTGSEFGKQCPAIIERVLFSSSDLTVGIQIADLYCYPVLHVFEYDKGVGDYWRFADVTRAKLYKGNVHFFPDHTKTDFRYFA